MQSLIRSLRRSILPPNRRLFSFKPAHRKQHHTRLQKGHLFVTLGLVGLAGGFYLYNLEQVKFTDRWRFMIVPIDQDNELGEGYLEDELASGTYLRENHAVTQFVSAVANELAIVGEYMFYDIPLDASRSRVVAVKGKKKEDEEEQKKKKEEEQKNEKRIPSASPMSWKLAVLQNGDFNACCMPGGKIIVNTGAIQSLLSWSREYYAYLEAKEREEKESILLADSNIADSIIMNQDVSASKSRLSENKATSDQKQAFQNPTPFPPITSEQEKHFIVNGLAFVLAHEISHALARHQAESMSHLPFFWPLQFFSSSSTLLDKVFPLASQLPHNRLMEYEADMLGLFVMSRAGFDPRVAPFVMKKMNQDPHILQYLSTHPVGGNRSKRAEQLMEQALRERTTNVQQLSEEGCANYISQCLPTALLDQIKNSMGPIVRL